MTAPLLNPCELEIDLFCRGVRIDPSCDLDHDARRYSRTRAGLGSGLELVIPGDLKKIFMNVPTGESFTASSPYLLEKRDGSYRVVHDDGRAYDVIVPQEPRWYSGQTSAGTPNMEVGVLQGTYLGIYVGDTCSFWHGEALDRCQFCTTGLNVGSSEKAVKTVEDVVDVCRVAREESGVTFVHLNSGYQGGDGLRKVAPYVKAIKEKVGMLVGVQLMPSRDHSNYDRLIDLGADHFSFCYEFHNPEYFERYLPGKTRVAGQKLFFEALEYTSRKMGKGRVSGEIIAGVEPVEDTLRAIDYITGVGAFPTICIFRPLKGSVMEDLPSPGYEEMRRVMEAMYHACRRRGIGIGLAPNIEVSLICQPDDARYLGRRDLSWRLYEWRLKLLRLATTPLFRRKLTPQPRPSLVEVGFAAGS
ncbi:MAG: radical SAM protein [Planctomycetota bacterium]